MNKFLQKYIPGSWQKKWYHFKNPGIIDEGDIIWKLIAKNDTHKIMFDVGAHFGHSLEPFARKGWKIYAFEPDPDNRNKLLKTVARYPNVHVESIALADIEAEEMTFFSSEVSTGISSLLSFHQTHQEYTRVRVTTLASYCTQNNINNISYLKTDTEGYDLPVLRGYNWGKSHPRAILSEFDNFKTKLLGYNINDQVNLLRNNGYKILISEWYPIEEYGRTHKWRRFVTDPSLISGERVWGNVISVKENDWSCLLTITRKFGKIEGY